MCYLLFVNHCGKRIIHVYSLHGIVYEQFNPSVMKIKKEHEFDDWIHLIGRIGGWWLVVGIIKEHIVNLAIIDWNFRNTYKHDAKPQPRQLDQSFFILNIIRHWIIIRSRCLFYSIVSDNAHVPLPKTFDCPSSFAHIDCLLPFKRKSNIIYEFDESVKG